MKKEIAMQWVKALESGDYKQGTGALRQSTREGDLFCCLGVLCNLHALEHPKLAATNRHPERYLGEPSWLPSKVLLWAGMDNRSGAVDPHGNPLAVSVPGGRYYSLMSMNDSSRYSFKDIAKIIRKRYKDL